MEKEDLISQIDEAITAHDAMKRTLIFAINLNELNRSPEDIGNDHKCPFGHWLHGHSLDHEVKTHKPYQVVNRLHAEFHQVAAQVARLAQQGRKEEAFGLLDGEFAERSDTLKRALNKWRGEQTH